jgi:threonine dehydrogenase-like Zn-dependent dehydrogenase
MHGIFAVAPNRLEVLELPEPEPGPFEALVQVEACAICNSTDWKLIEGEFFRGTYPLLLGHESVGRVIRLGERVRNFKLGERVLRTTLRDQHLPWPGGRSCWGGFAERAIVTDAWAEQGAPYDAFPHPQQKVPSSIPAAPATMLITLKETLSCLESTQVRPGHSLAIIGTGPVAQALTYFAKLSGISPVVVFGRRAEWAGRFERLGAVAYVWQAGLPEAIRRLVGAQGFDRVIEAVGAPEALQRARQIAAPDGRINLYGVAAESKPYLPADEADRRVFRGQVAEAETHAQLLDWVAQGKVNLEDWVDQVLPWQEFASAFEMVQTKRANKVVLAFTGR